MSESERERETESVREREREHMCLITGMLEKFGDISSKVLCECASYWRTDIR